MNHYRVFVKFTKVFHSQKNMYACMMVVKVQDVTSTAKKLGVTLLRILYAFVR